jgi:hypothetical protein
LGKVESVTPHSNATRSFAAISPAPGRAVRRRELVSEAACGAVGEAEELELVGADLRALLEQLEAALAHLRVLFVREQLEPVA